MASSVVDFSGGFFWVLVVCCDCSLGVDIVFSSTAILGAKNISSFEKNI